MIFQKISDNSIFKRLFFQKNKGLTVLCYHGIVDIISDQRLERNFHTTLEFEQHLLFLKKKKYIFINANELVHYIENPEKNKTEKLVCITFDDGYKNNLKVIEILNKHNIPGIFFLSSNAINSKFSIWTVNISLLLLKGNLEKLIFNEKEYSIETESEKQDAFNNIRNQLKKMKASLRQFHYNLIVEQFPDNEIERLITIYDSFKMLTWDDIRNIQNEDIQFHSHGHFHEIHHENQEEIVLENEIVYSKKEIEKNLSTKVFLFVFPNGNFNKRSIALLENNGYKAGFTLKEMIHDKYENNRYCISRITPNRKIEKFKKQINSFKPDF